MAIEHKAFIFDYNAFSSEVAIILNNGLLSKNSEKLIIFIENNLSNLKEPDTGEPLYSNWKEIIEEEDISQYGDFAITKYYDPTENIGIGYYWEKLDAAIITELQSNISPLLGVPFVPVENYFDPGKLGAYFQSPALVKKNVALLNSISINKAEKIDNICLLREMLTKALNLNKSLYVIF